MKEQIYLPQFKGKNNPYDDLWYLSIEIARAYMFRTQRIGMGISDGVDILTIKYNEIYAEISKLSEHERKVLIKDSYFGHNNIYNGDSETLMKLGSKSFSKMSIYSHMVSKEFLEISYGVEEGDKEYKRRCRLGNLAFNTERMILYKILEEFEQEKKSKEVSDFINEHFDGEISIEDTYMMLDIVDTYAKYGKLFYYEKEER